MATYNPAVNDRSGEIRAAGLADAFRSFAGYGMQGLQAGRENRQRTEDMAFRREMFGAEQDARERQFAMANARDQQRFAMEMQGQQMAQAERKALAEERKAEALAEADGLTAAVLQSFGPRISEDERARVAAMPPQARKAWALTQSKLIPQLAEEERNQSPLQFTTPPGAPGMGVISQGGKFMGSYTIPQPKPAEMPSPEFLGVNASGEAVYGTFGMGSDGKLQALTVPVPGVQKSTPRPVQPQVVYQADDKGNKAPYIMMPHQGGFRIEPFEVNKTYQVGGQGPQSPAPSAPAAPAASPRPYYIR